MNWRGSCRSRRAARARADWRSGARATIPKPIAASLGSAPASGGRTCGWRWRRIRNRSRKVEWCSRIGRYSAPDFRCSLSLVVERRETTFARKRHVLQREDVAPACATRRLLFIASLLPCRDTRSHYDTPDDYEDSNTQQQIDPPGRVEKKCSHCP